jgi:hypothetical protein
MKRLRDRVLLVLSALGLLAISLAGTFVLFPFGLGKLWPFTVTIFVVLVWAAASEIKRRSKTVQRKWPLGVALLTFFIAHLLAVGWLLLHVGRDWGVPHFFVLGVIEVMVAGVVFEQAYRRSVRSTGRSSEV